MSLKVGGHSAWSPPPPHTHTLSAKSHVMWICSHWVHHATLVEPACGPCAPRYQRRTHPVRTQRDLCGRDAPRMNAVRHTRAGFPKPPFSGRDPFPVKPWNLHVLDQRRIQVDPRGLLPSPETQSLEVVLWGLLRQTRSKISLSFCVGNFHVHVCPKSVQLWS